MALAAAAAGANTVSAKQGKTHFVVTFGILDEVSVGALQYVVQYAPVGRFVGDSVNVECKSLLSAGVSASFNHRLDEASLRSGWFSATGFDGPTDLAECVFEAYSDIELSDAQFRVVVNLMSAVTPHPGDPFPRIAVTDVRVGGSPHEHIVRSFAGGSSKG